jgi:hypothetical protein
MRNNIQINSGHTHIKNCDPLVFGPRLAMDKMKGCSCFSSRFSSINGTNFYVNLHQVLLYVNGRLYSMILANTFCNGLYSLYL